MHICLFILVSLLVGVSPLWATTYWVSPSGAVGGSGANCTQIDGDSDPGAYMTPTNFNSANCGSAGDTLMFKAGTYTGGQIRLDELMPNGTSNTNRSSILCEGDRTCIIRWNASTQPFSIAGMFMGFDLANFNIGLKGQGFDLDCVNGDNFCAGVNLHLNSANKVIRSNVTIEGNYVHNQHSSGITMKENQEDNSYYTNVKIAWNKVGANASPIGGSGGHPHNLYVKMTDSLVEYNDLEGYDTIGTYLIQCYHICQRNVIRYNKGTTANARPVVLGDSERGQPTATKIYGNIFKSTGSGGVICLDTVSSADTTEWYNNVCDGYATFFRALAGANNMKFKNNLCTNGTCTISNASTGLDCGGTCSTTNPIVTAATHFKDAANLDYSLKAGSSQIDAGINVGLLFNGAAPDRGAFETFTFTSCEVRAADTSKVRVAFTNAAAPPMLPSTGATGFTVRRNGASNAVSGSVVRVGDNFYDIPVTNAYTAGQTVDISWSSGNLTDSSLRGGSINQPYVGTLTNQSCINNAGGGGPSVGVFTQAAYEFHYYRGLEDAPVILPYGYPNTGAAENFQGFTVMQGGKVRVRFSITCTGGDCPTTGFNMYRSTGGGYTPLTDDFGLNGGFKFCGDTIADDMPINGLPTTNQLSTSGTLVPGAIIFTVSGIPTITLADTQKTELEYCVAVRDIAAVDGIVDLRVYQQDGTPFTTGGGAYTVTPRISVKSPAAGGAGF